MRLVKTGLVVLALTALLVTAAYSATSPASTPEKAVAQLMSAASGLRVVPEKWPFVQAVSAFGEKAVPAIREGLSRADDKQRAELIRALDGIGADSATFLLVELAADDTVLRGSGRGLYALENRTIRRPLSPSELKALTGFAASDNVGRAGLASRVLAKCVQTPVDVRIAPVVARYKKEILSPAPLPPVVEGSYVSPRVFVRNQFLLAFASFGEAAFAPLNQERESLKGNDDAQKWFALALGMAGDGFVASELKSLVANEKDPSMHWLAVRAYAASTKQDAHAVPALGQLPMPLKPNGRTQIK